MKKARPKTFIKTPYSWGLDGSMGEPLVGV